MEKNGLRSLIESTPSAEKYFSSLPDHIQGGVMLHSAQISTEDDLRRCADLIFKEFE